ncbi:MAG: glucose-1-phosphate thymidylyltransferase RfbA [Firmicutes bacterium]|nr:glucose-1-phosphate thymidylyltransferase RfbA [Bacillota bacterium]
MKGIILAGGKGTRLYPSTKTVSKQLLPIYDKPLIYYPLSVLMLAHIKDILIISTPEDTPNYQRLLGDGSQIGINIEYVVQEQPRGLAEAFILGEQFLAKGEQTGCCLILGDNVFYGQMFSNLLTHAKNQVKQGGAAIFGYPVTNPSEFGVVAFDKNDKVTSIEEKPKFPKSHYAVPGLYFYDNDVVNIAKNVKPSERGEVEITAVNDHYLQQNKLYVTLMGRGMAWLDTGSADRMLKAAAFVQSVQEMQGFYISCIEEIAWRNHFIDTEQFLRLGNEMKMTDYGQYILEIAKEQA